MKNLKFIAESILWQNYKKPQMKIEYILIPLWLALEAFYIFGFHVWVLEWNIPSRLQTILFLIGSINTLCFGPLIQYAYDAKGVKPFFLAVFLGVVTILPFGLFLLLFNRDAMLELRKEETTE
ncbi:MAG: hypothetical protein Q4P28_04225 [Tissierellia bacterium]|nr:hypothetical protein [Tissierellia bacterium]